MKLTTRTRYGLRALVDIGINSPKGPVLLKDICRRHELSLKYLDHIITMLKIAGFVRNAHGGSSGYILAREPEKITLIEIIRTLENDVFPTDCAGSSKSCKRARGCAARVIWKKVRDSYENALNIELKELIDEQKETDKKERVQ
jgi:Rrf2 family protein